MVVTGGEPMSEYTLRVRESILPLSLIRRLPEAFEEWSFTNETVDHEVATETCELCGHEKLRYHFGIGNRHTHRHLWVGSHCILQFNVAVVEFGRLLSPRESERHLTKLKQQMQIQFCIRSLEKLATREGNSILSSALDYYCKNKKLTPKFANVVFWKLQQYGVEHHPSFFQIELKKLRHVEDLRTMPTERVHRFWGALSSAQRRKANALGHHAPLA
jgi:hypothetical protein